VSEQEEKEASEVDERAVLEMLITTAQTRLDGQLRDNDAFDAKAFGVLGAAAAAIGVLIAVHSDINRFWWIPTLGLGIAGVLLLVVVWPRRFDLGPDPGAFYTDFALVPLLEAYRQMLAELLSAFANNRPIAVQKTLLGRLAFPIFGLSLLGSVVVALLR
jgi:hypothetical protein